MKINLQNRFDAEGLKFLSVGTFRIFEALFRRWAGLGCLNFIISFSFIIMSNAGCSSVFRIRKRERFFFLANTP